MSTHEPTTTDATLTAALRDVLAISREDIDRALTCNTSCYHEGTPLPECPEHGCNEAQVDAIRNLYRSAIAAHVNLA